MLGDLVETVEADFRPVVFSGKRLFWAVLLAPFAYAGGMILGAIVGVMVGMSAGLGKAVALVAAVLPFLLNYVFPAIVMRGTTYEFDEEHIEGLPYDDEPVAYEEVTFTVESASASQALFEAADFELVRADDDNVTLENVAEPDLVREILDERCPSPTELLEKQEAKKEGKQSATNVFIWWLWWNEHDPELENDWCEDDLPEWCDGEPEVPAPDEPPAETVGDCPATVVDEAAFADVTGVEVGSADMDDLDSELLDAAAEFGEGTEAFETSEVADVDAGGFDAGGMDAGGADADGADAGGADAGGGDF